MTLNANHHAARAVAARWNLTVHNCIAETTRAFIFKVDSPHGPAALKLYKQLGASGEGSALPFLRNLTPGVGPAIHRVNLLRTAILMEWLEGPTLGHLIAEGQDTKATQLLGEVAQSVLQTPFRRHFLYRRVIPRLKQKLQNCAAQPDLPVSNNTMQRTMALLDQLQKTTTQEKVIHGDLLFNNVIFTPNGPRLIDPKGWRADPPLELAKCLVQPYDNVPLSDFESRTQDRALILAEATDTTPLRLIQWATVLFGHRVISRATKTPAFRALEPHVTALLDMSEK